MSDPLHDTILRHVNDPNYRAVKPKVIVRQLDMEIDSAAVKKAIKRLVKAGKLAYGPRHLVCSMVPDHPSALALSSTSDSKSDHEGDQAKSSSKHVVGTFRRTAKGFGFVRPEGTLASAGREEDIFVSEKKSKDAANGDTVRLRLSSKTGARGLSSKTGARDLSSKTGPRDLSSKTGQSGRPSGTERIEGRVIDVVERATNTFVGTYFEQSGMGLVQVDGKLFSNPIYVGDPGAKGARDDDKVVLEMVRFPSHVRDGEGVILKILGGRGEPGIDTLSIIHEFNLPGEFPEEVHEESRRQADLFDSSAPLDTAPDGRRDLTSATVITIDPKTARDFDDAISLERLEGGHWRLGVHIADVSHFVEPGSPLDQEAFNRATSVYLPDQVIPMLPEVISNNLASLQPEKVRYSVTAEIEFTGAGARVATDLSKSAIKSCRRFTYEEIDEYLAEPKQWEAKLTPQVHQLVGQMHELAMILRRRRFERGALELSMPELEIDLDAEGRVCGAHLEQNTESHQIIEEFMLAANEAVAEELTGQGVNFLRRVHGNPDPRKLKSLTDFVRELGLEVESLESRFALQQLLDKVKGDPREHAVNYAALRSMQRAIYGPQEEGHYALASDCYCHFTSPIRRYPDLTIHRLIESIASGTPPDSSFEKLLALGDHCSEREARATQAERELNKVKLLHYMEDKIGTQIEGIITGVERFGLFILGTEIPAEGFVHISALADDHYRYDRTGHVLQGFRSGNTWRLGDRVLAEVVAVDIDRRELDFRLLGRVGGDKNSTKKNEKKRPKRSAQGKTSGRGKPSKKTTTKPAKKPKKVRRGGEKR